MPSSINPELILPSPITIGKLTNLTPIQFATLHGFFCEAMDGFGVHQSQTTGRNNGGDGNANNNPDGSLLLEVLIESWLNLQF